MMKLSITRPEEIVAKWVTISFFERLLLHAVP
jgi:hypothetical protein